MMAFHQQRLFRNPDFVAARLRHNQRAGSDTARLAQPLDSPWNKFLAVRRIEENEGRKRTVQ
ncbi:MAG: hypothetical protein QOG25_3240 [Acetobacteraceae bacterium]|nr:hypothetical protein [Acetobacteraceae bacterium]